MAKSTSTPPNPRQAKIQAASKNTGRGANTIVVAAVVVIVAIVAVVGGVIWMDRSGGDAAAGDAVPAGTAMGEGFRAYSDAPAKAGAPTVDIFEDFQCPACAQFEQVLGPTVKDLATSGAITLRYHVKTFLDDNLGNDASTRAGNGAFCAAREGKFQEFHDLVYANQPAQEGQGWTDAGLKGFAEQAGITGDALTQWETCTKDGSYTTYLQSVEEASFKAGVRGTPTVKINGTEVELKDIGTPELFTAAVQNATK
ncbi:MAG TPA: thioredoxin domain-containing protein [Dermatophilaceae bacterium]|nr:thioredoxin domain-containing protein [Dermatophilaceae bacterium]